MSETTEKNPLGAGRKPKTINFDRVDELLEMGCYGTEVAAEQGVHFDTLVVHMTKAGLIGEGAQFPDFTAYAQHKLKKGNTQLREAQHRLALNGEKAMLIWLGKQRLGQSEKIESKHAGSIDLSYRMGESLIKIASEPVQESQQPESGE